jgi:hypothetical protein
LYESPEWKIKFEEFSDPLWLILVLTEDENGIVDVFFGVGQAKDEEEALGKVDKPENCFLLKAYNILSVISEAEYTQKIYQFIDTASEG